MAGAASSPVSFAAQADALLRKNLRYQSKNWRVCRALLRSAVSASAPR